MDSKRFMLVVNAANIEKDYQWVLSHLHQQDVQCENISQDIALLALQGPSAETLLRKSSYPEVVSLKRNRCVEFMHEHEKLLVSRTGYTGEDGFEIYCASSFAPRLWESLMETGKSLGVQPVGLGARDTLRLEARLSLYGHDLDEETTPYEAGLGWTVSLQKESFFGREALIQQNKKGIQKTLVGFEMIEKGIPRQGCAIWDESVMGRVTSGTFSPTLEKNIGLGYVPVRYAEIGTEFFVEIREKKLRARVVKTPFYKRSEG